MSDARIPTSVDGLPLTEVALGYAADVHRGQRRELDGAPFIFHPLEVASLLSFAGAPDTVVAAGVLHDVIEDTGAAADDLRALVGNRVTELVLAVSEDDRIDDFTARKAALRAQVAMAGRDALMLFAADKISKVHELRLARERGVADDAARAHKLDHYRRSFELLDELVPATPLVVRLGRALEQLDALPRLAPAR
jgi:(p)ppGpp synthase/HD superfamily hydrolase